MFLSHLILPPPPLPLSLPLSDPLLSIPLPLPNPAFPPTRCQCAITPASSFTRPTTTTAIIVMGRPGAGIRSSLRRERRSVSSCSVRKGKSSVLGRLDRLEEEDVVVPWDAEERSGDVGVRSSLTPALVGEGDEKEGEGEGEGQRLSPPPPHRSVYGMVGPEQDQNQEQVLIHLRAPNPDAKEVGARTPVIPGGEVDEATPENLHKDTTVDNSSKLQTTLLTSPDPDPHTRPLRQAQHFLSLARHNLDEVQGLPPLGVVEARRNVVLALACLRDAIRYESEREANACEKSALVGEDDEGGGRKRRAKVVLGRERERPGALLLKRKEGGWWRRGGERR